MTLNCENNVVLGTGPVGLAVMDELVARGRQVILVNRSGRVDETLPTGVQIVAGDVTDPDFVAQIASGADVVFHCAQPGYANWPALFPPINNGILEGVARTHARLVVTDNLYMYGPTNGAPLREDLPYAATGPKGRTRAEMATQFLDAHHNGRIQVTIGRASDFYGPRVLGSAVGEVIFEPALQGKTANALGNPDLPHTYTYIKDFARALVTLSEYAEAFGQAWHVPSAPAISTRAFVDLVAAEVGQPVKLRTAGKLTLTVLGVFVPEMREFKEMLYEFDEPFVVDHGRYRQQFGNGVTPHAIAIGETVAWYRQHLAQD